MTLGATREAILRHILYRGMAPVLTGMAIGVIAAFFCTRALVGMLFAVNVTDPLTFVAIVVLLGLVALVASSTPGRRATRIDPINALRAD